jgi:hypothetical protein
MRAIVPPLDRIAAIGRSYPVVTRATTTIAPARILRANA